MELPGFYLKVITFEFIATTYNGKRDFVVENELLSRSSDTLYL